MGGNLEKRLVICTSTIFFLIFVQSHRKEEQGTIVKIKAHPTQGLPPERIAGQACGTIK
jgi:hypothetical protein